MRRAAAPLLALWLAPPAAVAAAGAAPPAPEQVVRVCGQIAEWPP